MGQGEHAVAGATLCFSSLFIPNVLPGSLQGTSGFLGTHKVSYVVRRDKLKWREQRTDLCASLPPQLCARAAHRCLSTESIPAHREAIAVHRCTVAAWWAHWPKARPWAHVWY